MGADLNVRIAVAQLNILRKKFQANPAIIYKKSMALCNKLVSLTRKQLLEQLGISPARLAQARADVAEHRTTLQTTKKTKTAHKN